MNKKIVFNTLWLLILGSIILSIFPVRVSVSQPICPLDTLKPQKINSLETFQKVPVLNQGRIKPMDTYARNLLIQFSGKSHFGQESAVAWMGRFLFAPRTTYNDKIFLINHPDIPEALKIEQEKKRRYSFKHLEPNIQKIVELAEVVNSIDEKQRSVVEKEILRLYENLMLYLRLSGAFAYAFPHPDFTMNSPGIIKLLQLSEKQNQFSFYDILERAELLNQATEHLEKKEPDQWDVTEKELVRLLNALFFWSEHYSDCPLGIIPTKDHENEEWVSPMDIIRADFQDPIYRSEIKYLRELTIHYWNGAQLEFDVAARAFGTSVAKRFSAKEKKAVARIPLELLYNQWNLFLWAKIFYGLGFLLFLFSLFSERRWFYGLAFAAASMGFMTHTFALTLRILIMSRPPVSNLFETFIFVGLISVILGIILEFINKNWLGLVVASICGSVFLFIAGKFGADGDTMQMLVAVLNSNFWLSTHVLAITMGYAGCSVAGIVGHIYILQALAKPKNSKRLEITCKNMFGILGFGLMMTFLGTALGGIWADQSWGRFWGWDPKENGALLIILWCAIIFHARISKIIHPLGMAMGCILGLIVVIWAWFGVNLLSVGLHSYGFTSGIAHGLTAYVIVEFLFLAVSGVFLGKKGFKI